MCESVEARSSIEDDEVNFDVLFASCAEVREEELITRKAVLTNHSQAWKYRQEKESHTQLTRYTIWIAQLKYLSDSSQTK